MRARFSTLTSIVLIVGGVVGILYPALFDEKLGATQLIISLFQPEWTQSFAMRWILVAGIICGIYIITQSYLNKNRPVTVINANVSISINNSDWSETHIVGEFILRANHPNVTSYQSVHTPDNGHLVVDEMSAHAYCEAFNLHSSIELTKISDKSYEMLQLFSDKLPYNWYMPLVPTYFVNRKYDQLPHFLRSRLVKRTTQVKYINEHSVSLPSARFQAPNYKFMSIDIMLNFPNGALPDSLKARRERNSALIDIPIEKHEPSYRIRVNKLARNEVIRISWKPNLNKAQD